MNTVMHLWGLDEAEAREAARECGMTLGVVSRDDEVQYVAPAPAFYRIDVSLRNGKVNRILGIV